jgi:predicted acetyltransferase
MAPSFRPAHEDDLERLIDIHTAAFPDGRGRDVRRTNFAHNALGALEDLRVLTEGGALLAHAFLFPLEAWFGGVRVRVAGVATVGVAPEARGRGLGSQLVHHLHEVARARGDGVAVLHAFRQGFYARLGYRPVTPYRRFHLHPASIPFRTELPVRPAGAVDLPAMRACWDAEARRHTGALVRGSALWNARLADERRAWFVAEGKDGVDGYLAWTVRQSEPHASVLLSVTDMAARTAEAARSLWGILAAQRDQVDSVEIDVAADDPIDRALVDADRGRQVRGLTRPGQDLGIANGDVAHALGDVAAGPMLRVLDPALALGARGYAADGSLVLSVGDDALEIDVKDGRARVTAARAEPLVRMSLPALSAVAFGALPVADAARLGWVEARDQRALAVANDLFALPPYFSPDAF